MDRRPTADLVRRRRRELGINSQQELASAAGLALQTVSLVERVGLISQRTAEKLAPVLRLSPDRLLGTPESADQAVEP